MSDLQRNLERQINWVTLAVCALFMLLEFGFVDAAHYNRLGTSWCFVAMMQTVVLLSVLYRK